MFFQTSHVIGCRSSSRWPLTGISCGLCTQPTYGPTRLIEIWYFEGEIKPLTEPVPAAVDRFGVMVGLEQAFARSLSKPTFHERTAVTSSKINIVQKFEITSCNRK